MLTEMGVFKGKYEFIINEHISMFLLKKKYIKNMAIPVTVRGGIWSCEMLKNPRFLDSRVTDGGKVVSLTPPAALSSQTRYFSASGTHFC
jgi:hypothetical protein